MIVAGLLGMCTKFVECTLGVRHREAHADGTVSGGASIGRVTNRLVPVMAVVYIAACLIVIGVDLPQVPAAFGAIFAGAFTGAGVSGDTIGALIVGFQRAAPTPGPSSSR